jgi:hypothetical protein
MAEEKIFLDETFPIVKYNNTTPLAGLPLLKRRENAQVADVRVIVTDKRIVVDEKMTVLANIAAVSVGDDEKEVGTHNAMVDNWDASSAVKNAKGVQMSLKIGAFVGSMLPILKYIETEAESITNMFFLGSLLWCVMVWAGATLLKPPIPSPPSAFTPDYAVVIESAGTRDNALVSKDRMAVQKIVRAISDALVSRA